MDTTELCPNCKKPLVPGAPKGLCPECLMKTGFGTKTANDPIGDQPAFVPPPVEEIAKLFPQLEIIELLGHGGMGVVYKARQPRLNRLVALKILSPEKQSDPQFAERFEREARALALLTHPNIVAVYDFGEVPGNFYLLMEFVDGVTLRQLLQTRKISPAEALGIVPKICEALQYAHEQGIVHRDIKPENILLDKNGRVKIADFGIAKILDQAPQDISLTGARDVVGTVHYMAPEQLENPQAVDYRADIYSLGVVFYEMLTGELPIGKFQPPSEKSPMDVRLDEVVMHALEKEPDRRYQTASQMKTDVETIASTAVPAAPAAEAEGSVPQVPSDDYVLGIGSCVARGWSLVMGDFWSIVGVTTLILLLEVVALCTGIGVVCFGPLMGGLYLFYLKKIRGEPAGVGTAFAGFSRAFLPLFLGLLVMTILTMLGFLCLFLPGIYLLVAWSFTLALVIDKQIGFWAAMGLSRRTVNKHWWKFLGLIIVLWLIKWAGTLVFLVGYLIAAPVAFAAMMFAYEDIFGATKPAIPSHVAPIAAAPSGGQPSRALGWAIVLLLALIGVTVGVLLTSRHPAHRSATPSTPIPISAGAQAEVQTAAPAALVDSNAFWNLLNEDQRAVAEFTDRKFHNFYDERSFDGQSDKERTELEDHMIDTIKGPRSDEYYRAISTLAALRSAKALPVLREMALEPGKKLLKVEVSNRPRWLAIRALGIMGDRTAVPKMIPLLYHNNSYVRWAAQISLVRLTGQNYSNDWKAWGDWWNAQNGQPPFDREMIRWWPDQPGPDELANSIAEADRNFLETVRSKKPASKSPEPVPAFDTRDFSITGSGFSIDAFANGKHVFSNRKYRWQDIPEKFNGWRYTQVRGGSNPQIHVRAKHDAVLQIITAIDQPGVDAGGWDKKAIEFHYDDDKHSRMVLLQKRLAAGEEVDIPQGNWTGSMVLWPDSNPGTSAHAGTTTHAKNMNYKLVNLQNNKVIPNPTDADIRAAVASLHDDFGPVLALQAEGDEQPLQMDEIEKGRFGLNCKDGNIGYVMKNGHECSAEVAIKIIISYRNGTADWKTMADWQQLKL